MKKREIIFWATLLFLLFIRLHLSVAGNTQEPQWWENAVARSQEQLTAAAKAFQDSGKSPRTYENGKIKLVSCDDWTCGFFPGSLWYMYRLTGNDFFMQEADRFTRFLYPAQYRTNTHDLGFILGCSYGNGYRLIENEDYKKVLIAGANSLMTRFHPSVGLIKSWDGTKWQYPVIIDNMMNLEFLCYVSKMTGNEAMMQAAVSHADRTLANHFRSDYSSFHVVDYDSITGGIIEKTTQQGFAAGSSWARGQAWGLYGFTMMYRETKNPAYLEQAEKIAGFILNNPALPADKIPYWDFDAPGIPNEPRDASAAAIIASALIELSGFTNSGYYFKTAETILENLSSGDYLAAKEENGFFILKHSTGNWPGKSEIDVPLSYADYYFLEALYRYKSKLTFK